MFFYLLVLFTVLPALELALLIRVGTHIGVSNTILLIILTGVAGAYLARMQGFSVLRNIQDSLNRGHMPTEEMFDGLMILCGGVVLLTPGFVTDTLGFLLLIPWTRQLIKYLVKTRMKNIMGQANITTIHTNSKHTNQDYEDADYYE